MTTSQFLKLVLLFEQSYHYCNIGILRFYSQEITCRSTAVSAKSTNVERLKGRSAFFAILIEKLVSEIT